MSNNPEFPSLPINDATSAIIYSPRASADDLVCSLSPTSSLNGIYVRSRPTSMELSNRKYLGLDFGNLYQAPFNVSGTVQQGDQSADSLSNSSFSNDNELIFTPITSESGRVSSGATSVYTDEEYPQKNAARRTAETQARVKVLSEGHALTESQHYPESILTTASKNTVMTFKLGGHLNRTGDQKLIYQNIEQGDDLPSAPELIEDLNQVQAQKKRSIPLVYRTISKRVYGVFHRKTHSIPESIVLDSRSSKSLVSEPSAATLIQEPKPAEAIKSSFLFAIKRRPTIDSQKQSLRSKNIFSHRVPLIHRKKNSFPAFENRASLRRSSSFAGFVDWPELDDELDEATAEATQVARWANVQGWKGCGV